MHKALGLIPSIAKKNLFLPGSEGGGGVGKGGDWGKRGEITQTLYAHMNKKKEYKEKKINL
jgi:hypothetical protein